MFDAWNNRAFARVTLGDYAGAIGDLSRIINEMPDNATAWYNRGIVNKMSGNRGDAIVDLNKAAALGDSLATVRLRELEP
jgi:tetratricopeptide (TPR) repeat protein